MIHELLNERRLPPLKSRKEMLDILLKEEYGHLPPSLTSSPGLWKKISSSTLRR